MMKSIFAVCAAAALALTGCSGFKSTEPPTTLYMLHAAETTAPQAQQTRRFVSVAEPSVPPGFESERIAVYQQQNRRMDYAAGAAWPAPLPKVLQNFIVHSAGGASGVMAVLPDSGIPAGYNLFVRVNDFEPVYTGDAKAAPLLKASMTFTLMSLERNKLVATFTESRDTPAAANTLTAITGGLEQLAQSMVADAFQKMPLDKPSRKSERRHLTPGSDISSTDFRQ